ncbi:MAG: hypothetical protein Q8M92_01165 [Candidatus Subteraquimicrobiales bacterium]|nr:hypothetical protein [Candidatus Subteraquimicrobiales bacterium]
MSNLRYDLNECCRIFLNEYGTPPTIMVISPDAYDELIEIANNELGFGVTALQTYKTEGGVWMDLYQSPKVKFCEVF